MLRILTNHYDRPIRNTKPQSIYYCFLEVHNCVAHFTSQGKLREFGAEKPISSAKPAHFDVTVWSHKLSTGGDALTAESSPGPRPLDTQCSLKMPLVPSIPFIDYQISKISKLEFVEPIF